MLLYDMSTRRALDGQFVSISFIVFMNGINVNVAIASCKKKN